MSQQPPRARNEAPPIRVLLIEPDPGEAMRIEGSLRSHGDGHFELAHAPSLTTALALLGGDHYDVVMVDLGAGTADTGPVERIREMSALPLVALADDGDAQPVVAALRAGAQDCLLRSDFSAPLLVRTLIHAVERQRLQLELRDVRRRERYLATNDSLTGLPNRKSLEEGLRRTVARASQNQRQAALLFLGLDRFRHVNDTIGHVAGDELLIQVATRLGRAVRQDDLVARIGGDEFAVLLGDLLRPHDAVAVAAKVHEILSAPFKVEERDCWVTPSIGIAMFPRDGTEPEPLIRNAYSAMRDVKTQGGASHGFFSREMKVAARSRMQLETRLRRALEYDELDLHYQPKVETDTGRIVGAEALLRWTDAELGPVEPKTVIPLAEETGLITDIGEWSLRTACLQNAEWNAAGYGPLRMSVNLSPRQMTDERVREAVVRALWDSGLDPGLLELEITENSLMANEALATRLLGDLKQVGVSVSLDDFGTGFSSLSYLKRFPVDILKIDQSFVRDIALDPDDAAIVGAIISIADNLDLGVIAEGVETEEQRAFLRARGCPEMQGFLTSPAVPAKEFTEMLQRQTERDRKE